MSGFVDGETSFERLPGKAHIANEVEEFVAGRFVGVVWVCGVENTIVYTELGSVLVEGALKTPKLAGTQFLVDVDKSVVEATAFDKVEVQERFDFVKENEGAARSNA